MDKNDLLRLSFMKACKYLREHPPCDAGWDGDPEIINCVIDAKSDPDGYRWMAYFLDKVEAEYNDKRTSK